MFLFSRDGLGAVNLNYAQSLGIHERNGRWEICAFRADSRFIILNDFETLDEAKKMLKATLEMVAKNENSCISQKDIYDYMRTKEEYMTFKS